MSSQSWTPEQQDAIVTRDCNLLVSAAAGAGKTAVLVERIIRRITDPVNPVEVDQLLVVSFTNAAAAEMRERVNMALCAELEQNPHSKYLQRQLALLGSASIMTLHAFCLDVLRRYYYCIDLDPGFKTANDIEGVLLRVQALEDVFENNYAAGNPDFLRLVDMYGGNRDDRQLGDMVLKLHDYSCSHPSPASWLFSLADRFNIANNTSFDEITWVREIKGHIMIQLEGCQDRLIKALNLSVSRLGTDTYTETLKADIAVVQDIIGALAGSWISFQRAFNDKLAGNLPRIKGEYDHDVKAHIQQSRNGIKKQLGKIKADYLCRNPEDYIADCEKLHPVVIGLVQLVQDFSASYQQIKQSKNLLDFNDMEHKCLEILQNNVAAEDLQRRYAEILIDEYQDINEVQETIIQQVAGQGTSTSNMFMVGDVKQSIYRFRLAEPSLFLDKYHNYSSDGSGHNRRINLACNFRSKQGIIEAVNYLFRQIMTPHVGELHYDKQSELLHPIAVAEVQTDAVEVHLVERMDEAAPTVQLDEETSDTKDADTEDITGFALEVHIIGRRIKELMAEKIHVYDKQLKNDRPLLYRDIVILVRAVKGKADVLLDIFREYDIPAYADLNSGYFEAVEIKVLLSLLQVIDNPRQDIALASVLRSPVCGLQAEDLALLRCGQPSGDFWDAVCAYSKTDTCLGGKLNKFIAQVDNWRTLSRQQPLSELIWQLYRDTGYYDYVGGMPGGLQRQANLRALYDRARQYEQTNFRGLFRFLRFIERLQKSGSDMGTARALGEKEDVVRIMSIHKSKGLEFPVVFVADIGKRFNTGDLNQPALCHKELGLGPDLVDPDRRISYPSLAKRALQHKLHREMLSEEMRILYVALTRARERLILIGSIRNISKSTAAWCDWVNYQAEILPDWLLVSARSWLDWLGPAFIRHGDGQILRINHFGEQATFEQGSSKWCIKTWPHAMFDKLNCQDTDNLQPLWESIRTSGKLTLEYQNPPNPAICQRLNWLYPYAAVIGCPAKWSVSELKQSMLETGEAEPIVEHFLFDRPRFLQAQTGLSPAERGSAVHLVLQHVRLDADIDEGSLREQVLQLIQQQLLTAQQAAAVNMHEIIRFFKSDLGQRLLKSTIVYREMKFSMSTDAARLYPGAEQERVFVQGVIDCLFYDGKRYVLIDYKTDYAGHHIDAKRLEGYQQQLTIYREAVEQLFKLPVSEAYLYFTATGESVAMRLAR